MDRFDHTPEPPWPDEVQPEHWRLTSAANAASKAANAAVEMHAAAEKAWLIANDYTYIHDTAQWATEATQAARQCRGAVAQAAALLNARTDFRQKVADYRNVDVAELQWDDENDHTDQTVLDLTWRAGELAIAAYRAAFQAATEVAFAVLNPHRALDQVSYAFDVLGASAPDDVPELAMADAAVDEARSSIKAAIGFLQDAAEVARKTRDDGPRADFMRAADALEFAAVWLGEGEDSHPADLQELRETRSHGRGDGRTHRRGGWRDDRHSGAPGTGRAAAHRGVGFACGHGDILRSRRRRRLRPMADSEVRRSPTAWAWHRCGDAGPQSQEPVRSDRRGIVDRRASETLASTTALGLPASAACE